MAVATKTDITTVFSTLARFTQQQAQLAGYVSTCQAIINAWSHGRDVSDLMSLLDAMHPEEGTINTPEGNVPPGYVSTKSPFGK